LKYVFLPALALAVLGGATAPGVAHAYCRTTTSPVPSGYDPVQNGCWTDGTPLAWHSTRVPYGVGSAASRQVSLDDATRIADLAFGAWNSANCSGRAPNVEAYDDGPIASVPEASDCNVSSACDPAARDVIVFDDDSWPHSDPANSLALTTITYAAGDGTILEAYTEVNSAEHELTTLEPPPADGGAYDLQAILTHEAGHFLGLAHSAETTAIMYAFYEPGAIALTADDTNGICAIYPPSAPSSGGCSMSGTPTPAGSTLLGTVLVVLYTRRRRLGVTGRQTLRARSPAVPEPGGTRVEGDRLA
jgi:MYXO-CTERM domain-containing protein